MNMGMARVLVLVNEIGLVLEADAFHIAIGDGLELVGLLSCSEGSKFREMCNILTLVRVLRSLSRWNRSALS